MREGWTYKTFGEVFDLQMGRTPDRKNPSLFGGDNIWVSIRDIDGKYIDGSKEHITNEAVVKSGIKLVKKGTVIMSFKLTVGKCAIARKDLYTNEAIMAFNVNKDFLLDSSFLYYYLQDYQWSGTNKAVMGLTLNKATISKQKIAIPPLAEQERIVAELDLLSRIIDKKKAQLKELDQLAQSIFYDMFGDPITNEKGWEVKSLGGFCEIKGRIGFRGYTKNDFVSNSNEGAISLSPTNIVNGSMDYSKCSYVTWDKYFESPEIMIQNGDILLVKTGSSYGKCSLVRQLPHEATINPQFVVIKDIKQNNIYITFVLSSDYAKHQYDRFVLGTAIPTFSQKSLSSLPIPLPPLPLQPEFASKIEAIERPQSLIQQSIVETQTLFDSRMEHWFN